MLSKKLRVLMLSFIKMVKIYTKSWNFLPEFQNLNFIILERWSIERTGVVSTGWFYQLKAQYEVGSITSQIAPKTRGFSPFNPFPLSHRERRVITEPRMPPLSLTLLSTTNNICLCSPPPKPFPFVCLPVNFEPLEGKNQESWMACRVKSTIKSQRKKGE